MTADQDRPDLLAILRRYYGDVLDNSPNGDMRYLSDALEELIAGRVQAAIKQEREACLAAIDDIEEKPWYGYENPNNFYDGKRDAMAAIRARS